MSRLLAFLSIFCSSILAFAARPAKIEVISGRIVAYASELACLNGNTYWSMIIHVQDPIDVASEFVEVSFSLPCAEEPKWLTGKSSFRKFRLIREKDSDAVLKEFMDCVDDSGGRATECQPIPIWKHVPDTEREKLPFGQRVPSYRSADLPLVPVV
jgi:hypothetical protein